MIEYLNRYTDLAVELAPLPAFALSNSLTVCAEDLDLSELEPIINWMIDENAKIVDDSKSYRETYPTTANHWIQTRWINLHIGFTFRGESPQFKTDCLAIWHKNK